MNHKYFEENIEGSKMSRKSPSRDNLEINKDIKVLDINNPQEIVDFIIKYLNISK